MESPYLRRAHYYETDKMGVVHHSNYIRWFEEARLDFLEKKGLPYDELEARGIMIPVLSIQVNFLEFVRYKEEVEITVKIKSFNGVRMVVEYQVINTKTNKLCNTGQSEHCFINEKYSVIRLKNNYPDLYNIFLNCLEQE